MKSLEIKIKKGCDRETVGSEITVKNPGIIDCEAILAVHAMFGCPSMIF